MNRRHTLLSLIACASGVSLSGCDSAPESERYTQTDIDLLAAQRLNEAQQSGLGRFGAHRYQGYRGLAELPWFDLDTQGQLICSDETVPNSIDMHCHLGSSLLFEPHLDLQKKTNRVRHLLDCDGASPPCKLDLDVYVNSNFTDADITRLERTFLSQGFWGSKMVATQTIPNLLAEMDAMRVERALILPIKFDFPFGDKQTEAWRNAVTASPAPERFMVGFSVHPLADDSQQQMELHASRGAKVMKLHPTMQRFYPDDERVLPLYEKAQELGITIFFHGGRAGIEPESSHRYAMPRHYEKVFKDFPEVIFIIGHAGARDVDAMLQLNLRYKNTYLGTHGQGITKLDEIIQATSGERILFGTDWPFYHLGVSLAKALIVTDSPKRKTIRKALLQDNALRVLTEIT